MTRFTRPGTYSDLAAIPGGFAWAWSGVYLPALKMATLTVERYADGVLKALWAAVLNEDLLFVRTAASPAGVVAVVGKGHGTGLLTFVCKGRTVLLGPSHGQDVCTIRWNQGAFEVWVVVDPQTYALWVLSETGTIIARTSFSLAAAGHLSTSQGLRDVAPDGSLLWGDPAPGPTYTVQGRILTRAHQVGPVIAGESAVGLSIAWLTDGRFLTVWPAGQPPNVAVQMDQIAVCSYTPHGAELAVYAPPYPESEPMPSPPIPPIGRPLWLGFFVFPEGEPQPSLLPGNCALIVPDPIIRSAGRTVAQYVEAEADGTLNGLNRAIAAAYTARPGVPTVAYWPTSLQTGPAPFLGYVGVVAYPEPTETLAAFEARIRTAVAHLPATWLICKGYNNPDQTADLAALVPVYARIARDCPQVAGLLVFSAGSRAGGWNDHPEIHAAWSQLATGITGVPLLIAQEDAPVNPKITVKKFGPTLVKGQPWQVEAMIGDTDVVVRIGGDGNLSISAVNAAGIDLTGKARHVEVG